MLSFHVDYWNRLGWTDPYSSAYSTQRQRAYAKASGNDQVYTPQMIVNGDVEFVGSDSKKAAAAIDGALRQATPTKVKVKATAEKGNSVRVEYIVVGQAKGTVLNIAAVVPLASNEVPRGENSGRTLKHVNVEGRHHRLCSRPPDAAYQRRDPSCTVKLRLYL